MPKILLSRALLLSVSLGVPLAASCAREVSPDEPSLGVSEGGRKSTAGAKATAGSNTVAGSNGSAFGGTNAQGGNAPGGVSGTAGTGTGAAEGGDSASAGGAESGGSSAVPPDVLMRASAVVYYETSHTVASDKTIQMKLHIKNQSPDPLPMAHVSIRYWFTAEATPTLHQYYTGPQAQQPMVEVVGAGPNSNALMTFGGGSIVTGADINGSEVQLEISSNGSPFDQSDDFSWDPSATTTKPNGKITLYLDDELIWGCEPSGKCFDDAAGAGGAGGQGSGGGTGPGGQSSGGQSAAGQGGAP